MIARPWGTDTQMKLTSVYFTKSKTDADTLISRLRYLATVGQRLFPATLDYFYYPSTYFYEIINEVLTNKMIIMDDYDDEDAPFHLYLKEIIANGNTNFSWSNTMAIHDKKNYPVIREAQSGIHIAITSDMLHATKEYDADKGYWGVHFTLRFVYFKPQAIEMSYNIAPYNSLLPEKYLPLGELGHLLLNGVNNMVTDEDVICIRYPQISSYRYINGTTLYPTIRTDNLYVPSFDTEHPVLHPDRNGLLVGSILLDVNLGDLQEVCNLNNLGDLSFTPEMLDFISNYRDEVLVMNDAPFCIKLMVGNTPTDSTYLTLDEALNLRTTVDMDPLVTYRLQIYFQTKADNLTRIGQIVYEDTPLFKEYMPILLYNVDVEDSRYLPRDIYHYMTYHINYNPQLFGSLLSIHAIQKDE